MYDLIIIGSGPAGLGAAIYAEQARLNTLVIEKAAMSGGQILLTEAVDNIKGTGTAVLNGQEWTARAYEDGKTFEAGTIVKVKEIRGVTLYVTESDAMPKKAEEAEAPKESEQ